MDAKLQKRVQRYGWDAAGPAYDDGWGPNLAPGHDALMAALALRPGEALLETACGTGLVTRRIAEAVGAEGRVLATDLSERMTERTAELCADLSQVEAARMDAEALDVPDGAFDAVVCALGLMFAPDPEAALREARRALRPGGRLAVLVWGERRACGWAEIFPIVDAEVKSEVCPLFFALGAPGAMERAFEASGLALDRVERVSVALRWPSGEAVLAAALEGGAVAMAAKRFDGPTLARVGERYLASLAPHREASGGFDVPGEFVVALARRAD